MKVPKFVPKSGQVDFTNVRWAPVVNTIVKYKNKILLVQRNKKMSLYPGYWNGISGFLDDQRSLKEKVFDELSEELGIRKKNVVSLKQGKIFNQEAPKYKKTWIVHPVLVTIDSDVITLDWEAEQYIWITPKEAKRLKLLPGFDKVLQTFF